MADAPIALTVDGRPSPLGVDDPAPLFGWQFDPDSGPRAQTAYELRVASAPSLLPDDADVWTTGRVESDQSAHVPYDGPSLESDERYHWTVRAWDGDGTRTAWSDHATFHTGLLDESDWAGDWVGPGDDRPYDPPHAGLLLRTDVSLDGRVASATAHVAGLGYYELHLNGDRVGDRVLDPAFTDYRERVAYSTYDVTDHLRTGANAVGVHLGGGWFDLATPDRFSFEDSPWTGPPRVRFHLSVTFESGRTVTVGSDDSWRWTTGPVRFNCVRGGETYDARATEPGWTTPDFDDGDWRTASAVTPPGGTLTAQRHPPVRVTDTHRPVEVTEPESGVYVFDLGTNVSGWPRLTLSGERGQRVTLRCGESLTADGLLDEDHGTTHTNGRYQRDEFVASGDGEETFEPRFTYHGFQYVQAEGLRSAPDADAVVGREVHTDLSRSGDFDCSNDRLVRAVDAFDNAYRNYHHHHPADPIREKMGWTHDALLLYEPGVLTYGSDADAVYRNWFRDMLDGQEENGHVPPIEPANGWGTTGEDGSPPDWSDPWWGGAVVYLPWYHYEATGDASLLERHYDEMAAFVEYLRSQAEDGVVDWWLGDWLEVGTDGRPERTPIPQTSTCGYYYLASLLARAARVVDRPADAERYGSLAASVADSFNDHFLDLDAARYAEDSQTAQALPLWLGMVPDDHESRVANTLVTDVEAAGHVTTGFVGTKPLLRVLTELGRADLVYDLTVRETSPSLFGLLVNDETTFRESWTGRPQDVHNIPNLASPFVHWLLWGVAGIRPCHGDPGPAGYRLCPEVVGDLDRASASHETPHGELASAWRVEADRFELTATVPPTVTAAVVLPTSDDGAVSVDGESPRDHDAVTAVGRRGDRVTCRVTAGRHEFAVSPFDRP